MKCATYLLFLVLAASIVSGIEPVTITEQSFEVSRTIMTPSELHVFTVKPSSFYHMNLSLTGNTDYVLRLIVHEGRNVLHKQEVFPGEAGFLTFTAGRLVEYTITVESFRSEGQSFTFTYDEYPQNDAGSGRDAPDEFLKGVPLTPGTYQGFLGGGDVIDYYSVSLKTQEHINITVIPSGKEPIHIRITDERFRVNIRERSATEADSLVVSFESPVDQVISLGVEGLEPYTLILESSLDREQDVVSGDDVSTPSADDDTPPPPPPFPGPVADDQSSDDVDDDASEDDFPMRKSKSRSEWGWLFFLSLLLLVGLLIGTIISKKNYASKRKKEEKEKELLNKKRKDDKKILS
jgi:hypothetical protein